MKRRSFFSALAGASLLPAALPSTPAPAIPSGFIITPVHCPLCGAMQPIPARYDYASAEEWASVVSSEQPITCVSRDCGMRMMARFAWRV